jgi:hypothetical protein
MPVEGNKKLVLYIYQTDVKEELTAHATNFLEPVTTESAH